MYDLCKFSPYKGTLLSLLSYFSKISCPKLIYRVFHTLEFKRKGKENYIGLKKQKKRTCLSRHFEFRGHFENFTKCFLLSFFTIYISTNVQSLVFPAFILPSETYKCFTSAKMRSGFKGKS